MGVDFSSSRPEMDVAQHEGTYKMFINLTKVSIVSLVILLVLMAYFLV